MINVIEDGHDAAGPNLTLVRTGEADNRDTFATNDHTTSSVGATYELNDNVVLVAGFHEGMTPMFGAEPEKADNMELGMRYSDGHQLIRSILLFK